MKCSNIKTAFLNKLKDDKINFQIVGNSENNCLPNILNIRFLSEISAEIMFQKLALNNIFASNGNIEILKINNAIRFSFSFLNTIEEIQSMKL